MFGVAVTGANAPSYATYLFCLVLVVVLGFAAKNMIKLKRVVDLGWLSETWILLQKL